LARGHARLSVAARGEVAVSVTRREVKAGHVGVTARALASSSSISGPRLHRGALFTEVLL
jgi:hypothetical protein